VQRALGFGQRLQFRQAQVVAGRDVQQRHAVVLSQREDAAQFGTQRLDVGRQARARQALGPDQPFGERRQPRVPTLGPHHQRVAEHGFPLLQGAPDMAMRQRQRRLRSG